MEVSREVGQFKKEHNVSVLQTDRYNEIMEKRGEQGVTCGLSREFVQSIFKLIHEESVLQQTRFINNK